MTRRWYKVEKHDKTESYTGGERERTETAVERERERERRHKKEGRERGRTEKGKENREKLERHPAKTKYKGKCAVRTL